jgi:cytochrome c553
MVFFFWKNFSVLYRKFFSRICRVKLGRAVWVLFVIGGIYAEDFITQFEYGQMLYQDPRGASCSACHGPTGAGELIAEYTDREGNIRTLDGPDIRQATLEQLRQAVRNGGQVMPRYFLTDKEIETIHAYLQQVNRPQKGSVKALFRETKTGSTKSAE